ncbi:MAG TPA: hypothetical protein VL027_14050 [Spongiibacteraceae bacterium]|jgi:hypothetical protein|nr:hypothetical protein [Spongiibacteraceae bacterium]HUH39058.1 hypothetical protein [Spongiibacteraceae bacterium]
MSIEILGLATAVLAVSNLLALAVLVRLWSRQRRLAEALEEARQNLQREISQVNTAAMGVGRHLMALEQHRREPGEGSPSTAQGVHHYGQLAGLDCGNTALQDPLSSAELELQALIASTRPGH